MCITNKKISHDLKIQKNTLDLANVDTFEYLGVVIDNKLKMKHQMDKVFKKVSHKVYTLSIMRRFLTQKTALLLYKVMILPHFDYVDFIIDSASNECTEKIERLHKRAIRKVEFCIDHRQKSDFGVLLKEYGLTNLYQRRAEHLLLFIYKFKGELITLDLQKPKIELRSKNKVKLKCIFTTKTKVQNSPLYRGALLWDRLPVEVQNTESISVFKKAVHDLFETGTLNCNTRGSTRK